VDSAFRVSGTIVELPVKANQSVAKGQLLARLDPRDFETRLAQASSAVAEARARLAAMQAGDRPEDIRILEEQLAAERARLDEAQLEFTRTRNLLDQGAATKDALDRATRALEVARAGTSAATSALARGRGGARAEDIGGQLALVQRLEAQQREARDALDDTRLTAPFPGIVARTTAETFQEVQARQPIVSLRDATGVEIATDVPESVMVQLGTKRVKNLTAVFDFLPGRIFPVTYAESEGEADPRTRTFAVVFTMPNVPQDVRLLPGMTATILVETAESTSARPNEWPVPSGAVFVDAAGKRHVWRVDREKQTVHRVPVTVGDVRGDQVVVLGGLGAGDAIVTAGVNHLQEGDTIRILPPDERQIR
jgi:RND family efflux transporter MFP subunit